MNTNVESNIAQRINEARKVAQSPLDFQGALAQIVCETMVATMLSLRSDLYMDDIEAFHEKFQLYYRGGPRSLDPATSKFRIGFLREEIDEYEIAVVSGDLEKQFDALIDLVYVAFGTAYLQGFPFRAGWNRVQSANMSKVLASCAADSARGYAKDVVKPPGWAPPSLTDLVQPFHASSQSSPNNPGGS